MSKKHTLDELNNLNREELITMGYSRCRDSLIRSVTTSRS